MKISATMSLADLAERMGDVATEADARAMRDLLVERFDGQDTAEVAETEWLALAERAAAIARIVAGLPTDAAVWVHDSGDVLVYESADDLEADRDNSRAVARHQVADPEALIEALIDAGIEYERG